ncbi:Chromosome transmission fidelity protein 8 [Coemansia sp. S610]|uniref:Chromosome transmission fidelity protein 8 n=1 Tax=Coemansia linderi TaxID=2663919 RepID=A0ACC1K7Y5_9FUNG|nr:Chromosome transmission fidelity protein 8 [Coemansia sp. RSA 2675]KAJ2025115.1 Chromosome transmission fidelity protein 8 [Coemansia sp. S610]KAJ2404588.1 Chromosome transmission fidelity protein 8 [Coemansia sp. RSA 2530]KAJ2700744.1 Chromosome transmission fidelity protein 8 [Coemansia sp. IMI 209128]KAJ2775186.1 Chromosome transmission fidelity protein 8 [Coemansia linderi]
MSEIEFTYDRAKQREFCLIETQGSLETDRAGGLRGQQRFGQIERLADGKVVMLIGVHRVPGSVVALKKPLAVLAKQAGDESRYEIQSIIKEKFLFKVRPDVILQQELANLPRVA